MNFEAVLYYKNQQSGNDGNGNESILRTPPSNTSSVSSCLFTSDFYLFVYLFVCFLLIWDKRIRWNSRFAGFCFLAVMFRSHLPVCVNIDCVKFRTLWYNVSDLTKGFFFLFYFVSTVFPSVLCFHRKPISKSPDHYTFPGKLLTYPSLKPTLTLTSHLMQNVGLGEGR